MSLLSSLENAPVFMEMAPCATRNRPLILTLRVRDRLRVVYGAIFAKSGAPSRPLKRLIPPNTWSLSIDPSSTDRAVAKALVDCCSDGGDNHWIHRRHGVFDCYATAVPQPVHAFTHACTVFCFCGFGAYALSTSLKTQYRVCVYAYSIGK